MSNPSRARSSASLDARPWAAAVAGALAGGVAIAASELVAGVFGAPSLVVAIGTLVIRLQPPGAKEVMVSLFGTNDKLVLNVLVVLAAVVIAGLAGILAARRFTHGVAVFVAFGLVAAAAAISMPLTSTPLAVANATIAVAAGLVALRLLLDIATSAASRSDALFPLATTPGTGVRDPNDTQWPRRRFLIVGATTLGAVAVAGGAGRTLVQAGHAEGVVTSSKLPAAASTTATLTADQALKVSGITPIVVPTTDFYKIDTTLLVPQVDLATWELRITGMVDHELSFTYDDLLAMPLVEQYVTIACVSNEVGDHLVGNALWTGVRLKEILAERRRPGRCHPDRRPVRGRLHRRVSDLLGDGPGA